MANVVQTAALGAPLMNATPRAHDDQGDSKDSGGTTYSHNVLQYSATEHGEVLSRLLYMAALHNLRNFKSYC